MPSVELFTVRRPTEKTIVPSRHEDSMEEDEARLFYKVQDRSDERETIRLVPLGEQIGLHPIRIRELARKWKNQGLVGFADPNMVWLTSKGEELGKSEMQEL